MVVGADGVDESSTVMLGAVESEGARSSRRELTVVFEADHARLVLTAQLILTTRADAEDAVAEVFGRLLARCGRLPSGAGLKPYVYKSVINAARSALRRRRAHLDLPDTLSLGERTEDEVMRFHEYLAVVAAVRDLPRRQLAVVVLRYWQGLRIDEVAACLGISTGAVKSHGARALQSMKKSLEGLGYGPLD